MNADYQDFKHNELTEKIIAIFYKVYKEKHSTMIENNICVSLR